MVTGNEGGWGVKELVNDSEKGAGSGSSWGQKVHLLHGVKKKKMHLLGIKVKQLLKKTNRSHKASRRQRGPTDHKALRRQQRPTNDPTRSKRYPMYRKAPTMYYTDHYGFPFVTFIDTPRAFTDLKSKELGQVQMELLWS
ncbi:acetyl-coenzyme A carboxylase carboxyl transferase subunit alpha, chloroplastic-like protein [Tanacetum coccineum]